MENNLIFEELSISDEVLETSKNIEELILQDLENVEKRIVYGNFYPNYQEQSDIINIADKIFDVFNKIQINIKYFSDRNELKQISSLIPFGGALNEKEEVLILNVYGLNNEIDIPFLRNTLNHELKHAFQIYVNKSFQISNLYRIATDILVNKRDYEPSFIINLSNLIYFFDKKEIDANMESLYQDLKNNKNESTVLKDFEMSQEMYYDLKDYMFDDEAKLITNDKFGKSLKQILNYIRNNMDYFLTKKRKVIGKIHKENITEVCQKNNFNRFVF